MTSTAPLSPVNSQKLPKSALDRKAINNGATLPSAPSLLILASSSEQIKQLKTFVDAKAQLQFACDCAKYNPHFATALKDEATRILRSDIQSSMKMAEILLRLAECTGDPLQRALGLLAGANCCCLGGIGEYQQSVEQYDEAAQIYHQQGLLVEEGRAQIGKILALGQLGRYQEALAAGDYAQQLFEAHQQWFLLARMTVNLGLIQVRLHEDTAALACFDRAIETYSKLVRNADVAAAIARVRHNRVIALRNLGEFDQAIESGQMALALLTETGQSAEAARCQQTMAVTNFVLGRYNEALDLLFRAHDYFVTENRQRDAILVDLYISDCLLQLRRFQDVLDKTQEMRRLFIGWGAHFEAGQAILNRSIALSGLKRHAEALQSLHEAHILFDQEGNTPWLASTEVEMAIALQRQQQFAESLPLAQKAVQVFAGHHLPVEEARAQLVAARAFFALGRQEEAQQQVQRALALSKLKDIPALAFQAHQLLGAFAEADEDMTSAIAEYGQAIEQLERMRGRVMIEFRMDFVDDKQTIYEDIVNLCLQTNQIEAVMQYVERAKSRSLIDLLAQRMDLRLQTTSAEDESLAAQLTTLRRERERMLQSEREQLYRRWERAADWRFSGDPIEPDPMLDNHQALLEVEKKITELWHQLLIRNSAHGYNAAFWQVPNEAVQPHLSADTLLLKYFFVHGQIVALLVTASESRICRLSCTLEQIQRLIQLVNLNMHTTSNTALQHVPALLANVQGQLHALYTLLLGPLAEQLAHYTRLIIVPHGELHYLPFHALYDGQRYLLETHEISYLPCATLLRFCRERRSYAAHALAMGYSYGNLLPHAQREANTVAAILGGTAMVAEQATRSLLQDQPLDVAVLHLATHGNFRADNPLFSGLALADGWLTTLDIFDLRLKTSLVTVSACQTGRNVIGGGDELLGLSRAFLYAGSASLLLSLWSVEDSSTALLMERFYQKLAEGWGKAAALRHAQLSFIEARRNCDPEEGTLVDRCYAHPYFWAPFFLVGDWGVL